MRLDLNIENVQCAHRVEEEEENGVVVQKLGEPIYVVKLADLQLTRKDYDALLQTTKNHSFTVSVKP